MNIRTSANLIVKNKIVLTFCYENYCYPPKGNAQSSKIIIVISIDYSSLSPPFPLLITLLSPFPTRESIGLTIHLQPFITLSLSHPLPISSYTLLNYSLPLLSFPLSSFPLPHYSFSFSIPLFYSPLLFSSQSKYK